MALRFVLSLLISETSQSPTLSGSPSFVRTFWFNNHAYHPHLLVLPDRDIIFAFEGEFPSDTDMVVYRLDNRGVVKWGKRLGMAEANTISYLANGADDTIAIMGKAYYDGANYGLHLTILTVYGSILMSRVYHYANIDTTTP